MERLKGANQAAYFEALKTEILVHKGRLSNYQFDCGHFGGGTPSAVPAKVIVEIADLLRETVSVSSDAELTIEVNPISCDDEKLESYISGGFNRVSIGVQSFNDKTLSVIGRPHRKGDIDALLRAIEKNGPGNFSIDLMYCVPGQSEIDLEEDLRCVVATGAPHITCFRLEIIPFTILKFRQAAGMLPPLFDDRAINRMDRIVSGYLEASGYVQYGAFNFSKPGFESKHNQIAFVAPQGEYVGFGNSAYSYINNHIYCNFADIGEYVTHIRNHQSAVAMSCQVSQRENMSRYFVLGLKFFKVSKLSFRQIFGISAKEVFGQTIEDLKNSGYLAEDEKSFLLTPEGVQYVNNVCKEFYTAENVGVSQYPQFVPNLTKNQIEHYARLISKSEQSNEF